MKSVKREVWQPLARGGEGGEWEPAHEAERRIRDAVWPISYSLLVELNVMSPAPARFTR